MSRAKRAAFAPEQVEITDLAQDGRGVAHVNGKTLFVDDVLPGETVEVQRDTRRRSYDEARLLKIITASPHRVAPGCAHFGTCGGCVLQHLEPAQQLQAKEAQLLETLKRIGRVTPAEVLPALQARVWNYRRRARLGVRWVAGKGRVLIGFRERGNSYLADLRRCHVLRAPLDELLDPLSTLIGRTSLRERTPQVEVSVADNAVALVFRVLDEPTPEDLAHFREFAAGHGVQIYLQPGGYETLRALDGPFEPLRYRLPEFAVELEFSPIDFIQVNGELNERMVALAIEQLHLQAAHSVLDLFCGLGNFSLPLARRAHRVTGIEGEAGLVERARHNAQHNQLQNVRFYTANLAAEVLDAPWAKQPYDRVLLDPPRAGAREVLPLIAKSGAKRLVYISCHPGSLARDAGILVHDLGFRIIRAGVMDMFPHTAHVESIAVFER